VHARSASSPTFPIICCSITASSRAKPAPAKHTSKMQSSRWSSDDAALPAPGRVRLHSLSAFARVFGAQSSSDTATSLTAARLLGSSSSESRTRAPRRSMSSAVSSAESPLKLPQWPSWPPGSGRMASSTSRCPGQRFTVSRTPRGRPSVRLLTFMPLRPGSMCSPSPSNRARTRSSNLKDEGNSANTSCPSHSIVPPMGSTTRVWFRRKPPPTASALITAGLFIGPPGPYLAWMLTQPLRTTQKSPWSSIRMWTFLSKTRMCGSPHMTQEPSGSSHGGQAADVAEQASSRVRCRPSAAAAERRASRQWSLLSGSAEAGPPSARTYSAAAAAAVRAILAPLWVS